MDSNKYLLKDIINTYNRLSYLEEEYKKLGVDRLLMRKNILKTIKELTIQLDSFNENVHDKADFWSYHPIGDRKSIQIPDSELFLNVLLKLANNNDNKYGVKRINIWEMFPDKDNCQLAKIRWIDLLSDKDTLSRFDDDKIIQGNELINILNTLTTQGHSFVMLSNLVREYDGVYIKEKIATSLYNDIIISVNDNDLLDICIDKLVKYMTKYGSDFSNMDIDYLVRNIDKMKPNNKKRKLTNFKYIKYDKNR